MSVRTAEHLNMKQQFSNSFYRNRPFPLLLLPFLHQDTWVPHSIFINIITNHQKSIFNFDFQTNNTLCNSNYNNLSEAKNVIFKINPQLSILVKDEGRKEASS